MAGLRNDVVGMLAERPGFATVRIQNSHFNTNITVLGVVPDPEGGLARPFVIPASFPVIPAKAGIHDVLVLPSFRP